MMPLAWPTRLFGEHFLLFGFSADRTNTFFRSPGSYGSQAPALSVVLGNPPGFPEEEEDEETCPKTFTASRLHRLLGIGVCGAQRLNEG